MPARPSTVELQVTTSYLNEVEAFALKSQYQYINLQAPGFTASEAQLVNMGPHMHAQTEGSQVILSYFSILTIIHLNYRCIDHQLVKCNWLHLPLYLIQLKLRRI